jgi:hypothetical protein
LTNRTVAELPAGRMRAIGDNLHIAGNASDDLRFQQNLDGVD